MDITATAATLVIRSQSMDGTVGHIQEGRDQVQAPYVDTTSPEVELLTLALVLSVRMDELFPDSFAAKFKRGA